MKLLNLEHTFNVKHKINQIPSDYHFNFIINEPHLVNAKGKLLAAYYLPSWDCAEIRDVALSIAYETKQIAGVTTQSVQFGYQVNGPTHFTRKHKDKFKVISDYAEYIAAAYRYTFPDVFKAQTEAVNKSIPDRWRLNNTIFTNGIINYCNVLPYHYDVGNFEGACTCVLTLSHNIKGGYLVFPKLRVAFEPKDCSIAIFDGYYLLHGVTPFRKLSEDAYRITIVYYTMKEVSNLQRA
ncbi:hypothetical protein D6827_03420 [Candidatus Parcubacteria bacterium]|nr:MAG: hypothetical protein D6827_03420 [Candidatus Parcubacteria bacterium]